MKILTFLTCAILIAPTAHAATKCVPDLAQMTCETHGAESSYTNSNVWKGICTNTNTHIGLYLEGYANCFTKDGSLYTIQDYMYNSSGSQVSYCWCNLREPAPSAYIFVKKFDSQSECLINCAKSCLESLSDNSFLTALSKAITFSDEAIY